LQATYSGFQFVNQDNVFKVEIIFLPDCWTELILIMSSINLCYCYWAW
jgi:hypothetical protein